MSGALTAGSRGGVRGGLDGVAGSGSGGDLRDGGSLDGVTRLGSAGDSGDGSGVGGNDNGAGLGRTVSRSLGSRADLGGLLTVRRNGGGNLGGLDGVGRLGGRGNLRHGSRVGRDSYGGAGLLASSVTTAVVGRSVGSSVRGSRNGGSEESSSNEGTHFD